MIETKSRILLVLVMLCLVAGVLAAPGIAAQDGTDETVVPREFQGARLGMTLSDLVAIVPEAKHVSLEGDDQAERTVVAPSKDRLFSRIEYRFSDDRVREFVIHYDYADVPGGYPGLLQQLRESYGKPMRQNLQEYYTKPEAFSEKKTIWKDRVTMASLTEIRKLNGDKRELILTITDLTRQQTSGQDQAHRT
ncbi:MAG: hypothetical protein U0236_03405 [Nitrospira sp.]